MYTSQKLIRRHEKISGRAQQLAGPAAGELRDYTAGATLGAHWYV